MTALPSRAGICEPDPLRQGFALHRLALCQQPRAIWRRGFSVCLARRSGAAGGRADPRDGTRPPDACSGAYSVNGAQYIARVEEETGNYAALGKDFAGRVLPGVEADDEIAYVLTFEQVVNGLPLSASYSLWYGAHWSSLCTEAVLSPAGVERLTLFSPYMPKSAGEPQALISYRAAALSLANSRMCVPLWNCTARGNHVRLCYAAEVRENDAAHVRRCSSGNSRACLSAKKRPVPNHLPGKRPVGRGDRFARIAPCCCARE